MIQNDIVDRYGSADVNGISIGISIWDMGYGYRLRYIDMAIYGICVYRYGHPGHRCGIWPNDVGDESIDMVILQIDMGYIVPLVMQKYHSRRYANMNYIVYVRVCVYAKAV